MRNKKISLLVFLILSASLLLAACAPSATPVPTINPEELITQAAGTVAVQLTMNAALTPSPLPATATTAPTSTQAPTTADQPTQPVAATSKPAETSVPAQTKDAASFVADVTIPDGTGAAPGVQFEKIWQIKNTGETTWTTAYTLNWVEGERMGAPDSIAMPKEVRPGEMVDLAIKLTAPTKAGSYQTFFRLKNASGQFFRLDGSGDLWLKISVGGVSPTPDLTETTGAPTGTPTVTTTPTN